MKRQGGFTLVEVIVVAGIIAILAGILVPLILKEIDESRISRAAADVRSISTAMILMRKDTGKWPATATCTPSMTIITGSGAMPTITGALWDTAEAHTYDEYLLNDANECWIKWKGPYMAYVNEDPWGNAYLSNGKDFNVGNAVWILSAGPDGIVSTPANATSLDGDDIGVRLK